MKRGGITLILLLLLFAGGVWISNHLEEFRVFVEDIIDVVIQRRTQAW